MQIVSFRGMRYQQIGSGIGSRKGWILARMIDEMLHEPSWRTYWLPAIACR